MLSFRLRQDNFAELLFCLFNIEEPKTTDSCNMGLVRKFINQSTTWKVELWSALKQKLLILYWENVQWILYGVWKIEKSFLHKDWFNGNTPVRKSW